MTEGSACTITLSETSQEGVSTLSLLSDHRVNLITPGAVVEFRDVLRRLASSAGSDGIRALVVRGQETVLTGGLDTRALATLSHADAVEMVNAEFEAFALLAALPYVTVAELPGPAVGFGAALALACDLRVADETTRYGFPEIKLGIAGGALPLSRFVGMGVAQDLLLTGRLISAADAMSFGLVTSVVPAGGVRSHAMDLACQGARFAPQAVSEMKAGIARAFAKDAEVERRELEAALKTTRESFAAPGTA